MEKHTERQRQTEKRLCDHEKQGYGLLESHISYHKRTKFYYDMNICGHKILVEINIDVLHSIHLCRMKEGKQIFKCVGVS